MDDGEEDAHGTQAGQGGEGDRLGVVTPTCGHADVWSRRRSVVVVRSVPDGEGSSLRTAVHAKLG